MASLLKIKAVKGVSWILTGKIFLTGIAFVTGIILARLLSPDEFGLISMITVFFTIAQVFINSGFGTAYVQKKEVSDVDADSIFFLNLAVSIALYMVLWFLAPFIAKFYEQPELIDLTRVMATVVIINAFGVIQLAQIKRKVDFKRKTKILIVATLISGTLGISAAYYGCGVWSLVIKQLSNRFFTTLGLSISNKWKPSFRFSINSLRSMFSYSSWILLTGIIQAIFDNIYIFVIGKFFPAAQLGFYSKAKHLSFLASRQIPGAVSAVSFPVFSKMQDNKESLKNSMDKVLKHTMFFTVPVVVLLILVAEPFTILFLTEKWSPIIPYVQLISVIGLLYPIHAINVQILMAQGKSDWNFKLSLIKNGLRVVNIFITYRFGVIYIIFGHLFLSIIALFINTYITKRLLNYGLKSQIRGVLRIFLSVTIAALFTLLFSLIDMNMWFLLIINIVVFTSFYILMEYLIDRVLFYEVLSLRKVLFK